jgi:archaeal flagellar protein FlaJ
VYPKFQDVHVSLKKGGMAIAYKPYIAFMVLTSIIALIVGFIVSLILLPFISGLIFSPGIAYFSIMNFLVSLVVAVMAGMVTMMVMYMYPGIKASNRKKPIENNLPYIANFLTLLSSSNVPPSTIFKSMSKINTLSAVRLEFSNIIRDVELFGNDLMNSILQNAKLCPNDELRDMLFGYVATVRTGGSPTEYLKITSDKISKERIGKLDQMLESMSAMAEIYIMMLVAAPLLFVVLFATLGMIGQGGMGGIDMATLLYLLTYLGIPVMGVIMMVIMSTFEK